MKRDFFLTTERIGFSEWQEDDIENQQDYITHLMN